MKRLSFLSFAAILCAVVACALLCPDAARTENAKNRALYTLNLLVMPAEQTVQVNQTVTYTNDTGSPLTGVVFSVYANAFRRESSLPYDGAHIENAFPNGYAPGGITFYSVMTDGKDADWGMIGADETYMRVACDLDAGETCVFSFAYYLLLTDNRAFLGCGGTDWRLTDFYPAACVFQYGEFQMPAVSAVGRFGYHDAADYRVRLLVPETYTAAAGGSVTLVQTENGYRHYEIQLENARDFCLSFSERGRAYKGESDLGTAVTVYGFAARQSRAALEETLDALNVFEAWFGECPFSDLTVAQSAYALEGETGGGFILMGDALFKDAEARKYRLASYVARQFFGECVYSDPVREPWLSKAVCEYAALLYFEETGGTGTFLRLLNQRILPALQLTIPGGLSVDSYATRFTSLTEYETVVRDRGAAVLNELRVAMGRETFLRALSLYYRDNAHKIASIGDFAGALNRASGGAWDEALLHWLYTIDDYADEIMEFYE